MDRVRRAGRRKEAPGAGRTDLGALRRAALLACAADRWLSRLLSEGRIGFHVPAGTFAPALVAAGRALAEGDWLVPGPREWPALLGRGVPLPALFHQVRGDATDAQLGHATPLHYGDPEMRILPCGGPVGARITQASGLAHGMRIRKDPQAVLCLFGESTCDENDFHVGLNFAGVFQVPAVFVACVGTEPGPFRTTATIAEKGEAYGVAGQRVEGADPAAVLAAVGEALDRARKGGGPALIEVAVDPAADPVELIDRHLPPGAEDGAGGLAEAERAVRAAWEEVERTPDPEVPTLFAGLYASEPAPRPDEGA